MNIEGIKIFLTKFQTEELADIQLYFMGESFNRGEFPVTHMITSIPKEGCWLVLYDDAAHSTSKSGKDLSDYLTVNAKDFIDYINRSEKCQ